MTLKALLFDVDGTLADTEETHRQAFNSAFLEFQLPYAWNAEQYEVLLRISGGKERLSQFFAGLPVNESERARLAANVANLHRVKTDRYAELVADAVLHVGADVGAVDELFRAAEREEGNRGKDHHEAQDLEHNFVEFQGMIIG